MEQIPAQDLYNALLELKVIEEATLKAALKESEKRKISLTDVILSKDLLSEKNLYQVLADLVGLPFVEISTTLIPADLLSLVPEEARQQYQFVVFKRDSEGLHVAVTNLNKYLEDLLRRRFAEGLVFHLVTQTDMNLALTQGGQTVEQTLDRVLKPTMEVKKGEVGSSAMGVLNTVIEGAYNQGASDVHIEPMEDGVLVRFRVDGILKDITKLPPGMYGQSVTRLKVMAGLPTDEHEAAQDGKIVFKLPQEDLDIRLSLVPTINGEKAVLRLLTKATRSFSLSDLGLMETDLDKVTQAFSKAQGMILCTGPTGSGKTTTLYSILKLLNRIEVNIATIEDPVEYELEGINQIQVNPATELTFAKGLRSIVRQDPNIILVGEIRDEETADIAVNSAMTGHLVLSSLHTNDAATTFPRLMDMNIEPFLVASTVKVIVAQRLVRKVCMKCRVSQEIGIKEIGLMAQDLPEGYMPKEGKLRIYKGKGCPACLETGYLGRVGIFEVLEVEDDIREAITARRDSGVIKQLAVKKGMRTMFEDGLDKVKQGVTTLEEVFRVISE